MDGETSMAGERRGRTDRSGAGYLTAQDPAMRVLLAEAVTALGLATEAWHRAVELAASDPDEAIGALAEVEVQLSQMVAYRVRAVLSAARKGMTALSRDAG
jgi:hypothetical protein